MKKTVPIWCALILALALLSCGKKEEKSSEPGVKEKGDVVATVNGVKITMAEFKDRIEKQSAYIRSRYNTLEKKKEFLDNMIRAELLAQAAAKRGYDKDPEVIRAAKQQMTQKLMREEFDNKLKPEDVSDEQAKKYYDEHPTEFNKPAMVRVSHILVRLPADPSPAQVKEARDKAMKIYQEAAAQKDDPNSFRKLAQQYSEDESNKLRAGDLGFMTRAEEGGPMPKEFSDAAFGIAKVNEVIPPVQTKLGFHVIRLTGRRDKQDRPFDSVKMQIKHRLFKEMRSKLYDDFVGDLHKNAKIEVNDPILNNYEVPAGGPAGGPGLEDPMGAPRDVQPIDLPEDPGETK